MLLKFWFWGGLGFLVAPLIHWMPKAIAHDVCDCFVTKLGSRLRANMYCPQHIYLTSSSCLPAFPDSHQLQLVSWSRLAWISTKEPCHFVLLNSVTITRQACPLRAPSNQLITTKQKVPLSYGMRCGMYRMAFLQAFVTLAKGYYHCERLDSPRYHLFNLPETRRMTQRWQNVVHSAGPALFSQTGKEEKT